MAAVKKTISISEDVANEASAISSNFSATVEAALVEYIHNYRLEKAIKSFGKWEDRKDSSVDIVKNLRRDDDREYTKRNDDKDELKA